MACGYGQNQPFSETPSNDELDHFHQQVQSNNIGWLKSLKEERLLQFITPECPDDNANALMLALSNGFNKIAELFIHVLKKHETVYRNVMSAKNKQGLNCKAVALVSLCSRYDDWFSELLKDYRFYSFLLNDHGNQIKELMKHWFEHESAHIESLIGDRQLIQNLKSFSARSHDSTENRGAPRQSENIDIIPPKQNVVELDKITGAGVEAACKNSFPQPIDIPKTKKDKWLDQKELLQNLPPYANMSQLLESMQDASTIRCRNTLLGHLQRNAIDVLQKYLGNTVTVTLLKKSIMSRYWTVRFQDLKMPMDAIRDLEDHKCWQDGYLIPAPSQLSRPLAMIFYNEFKGRLEIQEKIETKKEAKNFAEAFRGLGWPEERVKLGKPEWTFKKLKRRLKCELQRAAAEQVLQAKSSSYPPTKKSDGESLSPSKTNCSLFILCISSHGSAGMICGRWGTEGKISDILSLINKHLDPFIPKVVIIDACQGKRLFQRTASAHLKAQNMLLLQGAPRNASAMTNTYLTLLTKEIKVGNASIWEMHCRASWHCQYYKQLVVLQSTTTKEIFLRNFNDVEEDGRENIRCMNCHSVYEKWREEDVCLKLELSSNEEGVIGLCPGCLYRFAPKCSRSM